MTNGTTPEKKLPGWVAPVVVGGAVIATVIGVGAYLVSRKESIFPDVTTKASPLDVAQAKSKNISTFIIEKNHIEDLTDTSFSMKHNGDYVVFACPYDYESVTIYRTDTIDGQGTHSSITLNKGESKKITLIEENRKVDMFFSLAEPAIVDTEVTWDPEDRPHGTWWYRIGITAGGKWGYVTINPQGVTSSFKGAANRADAEAKAKAEIEAAGGTASTTRIIYETPPLSKRLKVVFDSTLRGYRMIVYQTIPGGEHGEAVPGEYPAYWTVTKPDGTIEGPNGADSIEQAKTTVQNLAKTEIPATTETIMYKNYKIELTERLAGTPPYTATITFPNGQYVPSAVTGPTRDACIASSCISRG
jgi:hypothetical protein